MIENHLNAINSVSLKRFVNSMQKENFDLALNLNERASEKSENLCENTKQILAENEARDMLLRTKFRQERS